MTWSETRGWLLLFLVIGVGCGMCGGVHVGSHEASASCEKGCVLR